MESKQMRTQSKPSMFERIRHCITGVTCREHSSNQFHNIWTIAMRKTITLTVSPASGIQCSACWFSVGEAKNSHNSVNSCQKSHYNEAQKIANDQQQFVSLLTASKNSIPMQLFHWNVVISSHFSKFLSNKQIFIKLNFKLNQM